MYYVLLVITLLIIITPYSSSLVSSLKIIQKIIIFNTIRDVLMMKRGTEEKSAYRLKIF